MLRPSLDCRAELSRCPLLGCVVCLGTVVPRSWPSLEVPRSSMTSHMWLFFNLISCRRLACFFLLSSVVASGRIVSPCHRFQFLARVFSAGCLFGILLWRSCDPCIFEFWRGLADFLARTPFPVPWVISRHLFAVTEPRYPALRSTKCRVLGLRSRGARKMRHPGVGAAWFSSAVPVLLCYSVLLQHEF